MEFGTSCSGECAVCGNGEGCCAGHGDDDYSLATQEQLINRLNKRLYSAYRKLMINTLKQKFDYVYEDIPEPPKPPTCFGPYTVKVEDGLKINVNDELLRDITSDPKLVEQFEMEINPIASGVTSVYFKQKR